MVGRGPTGAPNGIRTFGPNLKPNASFLPRFRLRTRSAKSGGPERIGLRRAIFGRLRVRPVNRSAPKIPGYLPLSAALDQAESTARMGTGGGSAPGFERSLSLRSPQVNCVQSAAM